MSNFFDTATLIFAFVWVICMGASFIAVLDWDGIIEAKRLKLLVPAAVVAQMLMFLVDKLGAAFYCGAFSSFTIVILNMIEKRYTYIYLALALAAMFGMMQRYHRD